MSRERRQRTRQRLEQVGVRDTGLLSEESSDIPLTRRRSPQQCLVRGQCLALVSAVALGLDRNVALGALADKELEKELVADERVVLDGSLEYGELAVISWRQEAAFTLSWALGLTPLSSGDPDDEAMLNTLLDATISDCDPRDGESLLDELDFAHCYRALYEHIHPHDSEGIKNLGAFARQTVHWRHEALVWAMDASTPWPPGGDAHPGWRLALRGPQ